MTGCGKLHCEAFFDPDNGQLLETYFSKGSDGGCNSFMVGLSRMISLAARGGIGIEDIVDQLMSAPVCASYAVRTAKKHDTSRGNCCPNAIGRALKDMYDEMQSEVSYDEDDDGIYNIEENGIRGTAKCPECGGTLVFEGGCQSCKDCGYSKCE